MNSDLQDAKADKLPPDLDRRPRIPLPSYGRLLSVFATELGLHLAQAGIYSRNRAAFTINDQRTGLEPLTAQSLRTWVEEHLACCRVLRGKRGGTLIQLDCTMSRQDAEGVLASPQLHAQLRKVDRLNPVRMPVFRENDKLELLPVGYDGPTQTLTLTDVEDFDERMTFTKAREFLEGLTSEFVFVRPEVSRPVAVAGMLSLFCRTLLPAQTPRPCFIYLGNAEGCGKTLLAKLAIVPVLGDIPTSPLPTKEEEMEKRLSATVLAGKPLLFLDNVKRHLSSPALEGFLTSPTWTGRILGVSKEFTAPNDVAVYVTGNACTVSPDIRRRSLFCELFLEVQRAEDRVIQNPLDTEAIKKLRGWILSAEYALVRQWDAHGRPGPSRTHATFPVWSRIVGGIVEHAGFGCPLTAPDIEAAGDTDGADMCCLVRAMAASKRYTFQELVELARESGTFERIIPDDGELDHRQRSAFAKVLARYERRILGDRKFMTTGRGRSKRYLSSEIE